jgi:uncharacterized protein (TIGR02466 family)
VATPLSQTKFEKLFSTPLFRFALDDADSFNAELLAEGERLRSESEGASKSNRGGWHSSGNLFDNEAACFQRLRTHAVDAVMTATDKIGAKAETSRLDLKMFSWMNINPPGGYNAPHTHPGAHWSGVYYVAQPEAETESSGKVEFLDPRTDLPNWRLLKAPSFSAKKTIRPEPGELILFPSYLVHWVYPNDTEENRVSIAFNATFRKAVKKTKAKAKTNA